MHDDLAKRAKEIITKILYITIATADKNNQPWNSPVYFAFDENYYFYWASWKENQHSKNINQNSNIFIAIYDSTAPEGTGEGVYIKAKAYELTDEKEILNALSVLDKRVGKTKKRSASHFLGDYPRRVYKAVPENFWVNVDGEINGNFIDKRVEIELRS
jgi:nitroimidazol reductase NimA-like FMN-containing flavoprotein (pyridoxamine 5'-phosphate oxidase superfamily)